MTTHPHSSDRTGLAEELPLAWHCCDERYPFIAGIVTTQQDTVEAWRESGIKFQPLVALRPTPALADELWEALKNQCAATKDKSQVNTLVTVRKNDVTAAVAALRQSPSPANCDCGFSAEVCKTNPCMRKKLATSGLAPDAEYPYCGVPSPDGREAIARIINPDLFVEYDLLVAKGTLAENGTPWAQVVFGTKIELLLAKADAILSLRSPSWNGVGVREALKFTEPPFGVYHNGNEIGDKNGHVCTAENPDIAKDIVAALNLAAVEPARGVVSGDTIKHMWDQVEKARADGTFSSAVLPAPVTAGVLEDGT